MNKRKISFIIVVAALVIAACATTGAGKSAYQPKIDKASFVAVVDNPYWPLVPGTKFSFSEKHPTEVDANDVEVTSQTKVIMGIPCVVVHDTLKSPKGALLEDTMDWYAQDKDGNVWYMGEDTKEYHDDGTFDTKGSWQAGVNGAQPGIVMPAKPTVGSDAYRQEYLAGEAEDMGQVAAVNDDVKVPAGAYSGCVRTKEWTELEAGGENKWYAKGVGVVRTESLDGEVVELLSMTKP